VLYHLLECIRIGSILLWPTMPSTCEKIWAQLATDKTGYDSLSFGLLAAGGTLCDGEMLFARIDENKFFEALEKECAVEKPALAPEISIDDFAKTELRAGKILSAEKVEKSDKLLKFKVDLGFETRQILSGIAKWYKPEEMVGKTVIVVANLAPAKLRGELSEGMLLAADVGDTAKVVFLPDDVPAGAKIR